MGRGADQKYFIPDTDSTLDFLNWNPSCPCSIVVIDCDMRYSFKFLAVLNKILKSFVILMRTI